MTADACFAGFPPDALAFLGELERDNSRAFFTAQRARYDAAVRQPLEDLVAEAEARHGPGKVFRPNRDVRFSRDKSPYKTNAAGYAGLPAVYVSLDAHGMDVGGGLYEPGREQLLAARTAIAEHRGAGDELAAILDALRAEGFEIAGSPLRTAPRGFDRDHPHIALLRLRRYAALRRCAPGPEIHDPGASRAAIFGTWERLEGLFAWLRAHADVA